LNIDPVIWDAVRSVVEKIFPALPDEPLDAWLNRLRAQHVLLREAVATALDDFIDPSRNESAKRREWIADERTAFRSIVGERRRCEICDKFPAISEAHHIVPLAWQYDRGASVADHAHVWLCPSHHALVHAVLDGRVVASRLIEEESPDILPLLIAIITRAGVRP
jgi:hypothetical protein